MKMCTRANIIASVVCFTADKMGRQLHIINHLVAKFGSHGALRNLTFVLTHIMADSFQHSPKFM